MTGSVNLAIRSVPGGRSQASRNDPEGGGAQAGSPGRRPASTSSIAAASRTVRAIGPAVRQTDRVPVHRVAADPPTGGLQPEQPAARRRDPDRATAVRALGHRNQPRGHRGRRPARGAARHPGPVPRRHRRRIALGLGVAGRAELRGRRLAEADHARGLDRERDRVADVGHVVREHRRAELRGHARRQVEVLDRGRHAEQRPVVRPGAQAAGPLQRELRGERDERAHVVETMGAFEVVLGQLGGRHLTASHQVALLQRGQVVQLGHDPTVVRGGLDGGGSGGDRLPGGDEAPDRVVDPGADVLVGEHVDLEGGLGDQTPSTTARRRWWRSGGRPRAPTCRRTAWA